MPSYTPNQANGPQFLASLSAMQRDIAALQVQIASLANMVDQFGNTQVLLGNLNQTVLIGASSGQTGVFVGTTLTGVGVAWQAGLATTTITTTAGLATATVASASGLATNMVIGAAQVGGVSAIVPGTFIKTLVGVNVTLSINAAKSGTSLFCAACNWDSIQGLTYP